MDINQNTPSPQNVTRKYRRQRKLRGGLQTRSNEPENPMVNAFGSVLNKAKTFFEDKIARFYGYVPDPMKNEVLDQEQDQDQEPTNLLESVKNKFAEGTNLLESVKNKFAEGTSFINSGLENVGATGIIGNAVNVASDAINTAKNKVNEVGSILVDDLVETPFKNSIGKGTITHAISDTMSMLTLILAEINKRLDDPQFQETLRNTANNVAVYTNIILSAADEPLNKLVDKASELIGKLEKKLLESTVQAEMGALSLIPGLSEGLGAYKIASKSFEAMVALYAAGAESIALSADTFTDIFKKVKYQMSHASELLNNATSAISNSAQQTTQQLNNIQDKINNTSETTNRIMNSERDFNDSSNLVKTTNNNIQQRGGKGQKQGQGQGRRKNTTKRNRYTTRYLTRRRQRQRQ